MKEVKLFVGPQHPGMHGNASIHMYVDGDIINRAYFLPGMLHRGFEKSMEKRTWMNNIALIPRICVPEPDTNEMVYAMNIEALAKIEVPERAHWIRMLVLEMARLAIHLMAFGGCGGPTGLYTAMYWAQADRDGVLELFEEISGQRIYHMYIVAGGVRKDLPKGIEKKILAFVDDLEARLPDYDYEKDMGGVMYLFLRGVNRSGQGVYNDKPSRELIETLDDSFAGKEDNHAA